MSDSESVKSIFPTLKQQLLFLRERKKLFDELSTTDTNKENETAAEVTRSFFDDLKPSSNESIAAQSSPEKIITSVVSQNLSLCNVTNIIETSIENKSNLASTSPSRLPLPDNYHLPDLPSSMLNDIKNGDLSKFDSHCKNRQILLDVIFHDLTEQYNIWYVFFAQRTKNCVV